ncbi:MULTISPECIES: aldo/keto reductase [Auritidibacter]|uniref:aldo/keto reductase n=1 Tax=Auritidibacter TaxID=1160973 RepID=UPI0018F2074B|nr:MULTISPECIES: aldo/keto reductase [Auritidibacter]WHS35032.1 aldo/keto reductase [Auritidibacter ignavus]
MSALYGRPDKTEAIATLNLALSQGVTFFDTAESYGNGHNETLLGEHLSHRDDIITPKFAITTNPLSFPTGQDGRPENCLAAVIGSLTRLRRDYIDLYHLHQPDPQVPIEESIGVMADLVHEGLIRHIGVSELTAELLRAADETYRITALQSEWSLLSRDIENGPVPETRKRNIGIVVYSPLSRGLLTGDQKATTQLPLLDYRRALPRWRRKNLEQVEIVDPIARNHNATPAQISLAWLLTQGDDIVPIPGTKQRGNSWTYRRVEDLTHRQGTGVAQPPVRSWRTLPRNVRLIILTQQRSSPLREIR